MKINALNFHVLNRFGNFTKFKIITYFKCEYFGLFHHALPQNGEVVLDAYSEIL